MKRRDQIVELFPIADPQIIYVLQVTDKVSKISVSPHGSLYNHYRYLRKLLREAGFLTRNVNREKSSDTTEGIHK